MLSRERPRLRGRNSASLLGARKFTCKADGAHLVLLSVCKLCIYILNSKLFICPSDLAAGDMNDIFVFEIAAVEWRDLTSFVSGSLPSQRDSFGFVGAPPGMLYLQGGSDASGMRWSLQMLAARMHCQTDTLIRNVHGLFCKIWMGSKNRCK